MVDPVEIARIAGKLTKAMREALARSAHFGKVRGHPPTMTALWMRGLIHGGYSNRLGAALTPLGLAVRAHILATQEPGNVG